MTADFLNACDQIGMTPEAITNFEQVDDWVGGPRYSFVYQGMSFRLYCNMDSTVETIKLGTDTDIFKRGYEPYQVSDYLLDSSTAADLQSITQEKVKAELNYPSSADFPWLDWSYGRDHDLYSVSSTVKAKNAFGVESDLPFKIIYHIHDDAITMVYFELDGTVIANSMEKLPVIERKQLFDDSQENRDATTEINLVDGELGSYGKIVSVDGYDVIHYYVPFGKYTVTNNGKWFKLYIAKDSYYKNSDGYMENEVVNTVEFSEYGETAAIELHEGEHIELTINATVVLSPI